MRHASGTVNWAAVAFLAILASACGPLAPASREPSAAVPQGELGRETGTAAPVPELLATVTPTIPWWLAPRPREMEAYGYTYEPGAAPHLPPESSVSMPIWGNTLPARTMDGEPEFLSSRPPADLVDPVSTLEEAGCEVEGSGDATCKPDSPLAAFGCDSIRRPAGSYPEPGVDPAIVGTCYSTPPSEDQPRDAYLFRRGCAFRVNAAQILKVEGHYVLLTSADALQAVFAPIESRAEALSYAQLATGLMAQFAFDNDPDLLYFQDPIEGTLVTETDDGYRMNLFHFQSCLCEPWLNSEVEILVDRSGGVTWLGATPISMTTGFSCAD
jgi:hypothetical protein